jgi:dCMP deaminase
MIPSYNWKIKYLDLAQHFSTWSKDPSSKIGAVVVGINGQILSTGYNGFPRGIEDTKERLNNRDQKYPLIVHAEMNCIYNAADLGVSLRGASLFVYGLPVCEHCSLGIIQSGIKYVCMRVNSDKDITKWTDSFKKTAANFEEAGIIWHIEMPTVGGVEFKQHVFD